MLLNTELYPKLDRPEVLSFLFHPRVEPYARPAGKAIEYRITIEKDMPLLRFFGVKTGDLGITEADGFGNYEKISRCTKPLLVIHAQHDQFIPVSDAQALLKNCPAERKRLIIIPGADHNSVLRFAGPDYFNCIKGFIEGK